jgi:hypothetical protein
MFFVKRRDPICSLTRVYAVTILAGKKKRDVFTEEHWRLYERDGFFVMDDVVDPERICTIKCQMITRLRLFHFTM